MTDGNDFFDSAWNGWGRTAIDASVGTLTTFGGTLVTGSETFLKSTIVARSIFSTTIGLNADLLIGTGMDIYSEYSSYDWGADSGWDFGGDFDWSFENVGNSNNGNEYSGGSSIIGGHVDGMHYGGR